MTIANKTFLGEKRLYFIADDAIWFDWKGSPLIVIENNIIKSIKISCVCEVLAEVDEFNDISDFCYLKKYIAELKKAKKLCKNTPLISMMVMDIKNFIISVQNVEVFGL